VEASDPELAEILAEVRFGVVSPEAAVLLRIQRPQHAKGTMQNGLAIEGVVLRQKHVGECRALRPHRFEGLKRPLPADVSGRRPRTRRVRVRLFVSNRGALC
jgi:hypothetical protein